MGHVLSMPQRVPGMLFVGEQRFSRFILSSMCLITIRRNQYAFW